MKVVILAGGFGSRLGSVTDLIPKPMIEIGGKPILWHIMKTYAHYGYKDFVICLGYKGNVIKDYFYNFAEHNCDFTVSLADNKITYHNHCAEDWNVTLVDTGLNTLKGGRIKRIEKYLDGDVHMLTYGDGVINADINELVKYHKSHNKMVTVTGVRPPSMFGEILQKEGRVLSFEEKPQASKGFINGGFMVFNKEMLNHLSEDADCDFEFNTLEKLAAEGQVMTFLHRKEWECADTVRDVDHLNKLWKNGQAFWKVWDSDQGDQKPSVKKNETEKKSGKSEKSYA
ncbi:glucose-1-phosphate cytidylyltransferase [Nafulsella turpanensis]|uniref:glucose-1-phosphate cytidylyltransferase n=1 Tax=Nafulsella turpanensis TaxID=1265690 RepID=UPI00037A4AFF|nr:glucose-1-phosphate cytidylyltransferase [Nafulsella turpanensis]